MRKATLFLLAIPCFGQIELVNNSWPSDPQGYNFYPDASVTYTARITNNNGVGLVGYPYTYTVKQYAGQGGHSHETANGTVLSRPGIAFIPGPGLPDGGETGVTDSQGYLVANIELNGFSGWYTVCATVSQLYTKCVNNNTRYSTAGLGHQVYLERYAGGLPPYDSPGTVNKPQADHDDLRHVLTQPPGGGGNSQITVAYATRWCTAFTHLQLLGASASYKSGTAAAGLPDLADVTRISLPDGGVYDNDIAGIAPGTGNPLLNWDARVFEEHQRGVEADIVVPIGSARQNILFASLTAANCKPGIFKPTSEKISNSSDLAIQKAEEENYWRGQGIMHVTCKAGQSLRGGTHPNPPVR